MLKFWIVIFTLFLTACTSLPSVKTLPTQTKNIRLFKVESRGQANLLSVQFEANQWRWVQTDPLGSPKARVVLDKNGWKNDGFIMPNQQAKQLFTAIAVALNPNNPPFELNKNWRIEQNGMHFNIMLPDGSEWKVDEL
ncbi:hypothetical protein [Actinobacillus suis]|uniref:Lipoprotein n=2 Tax=Actinobacillus suis TaxID=716 RepID=K0G8K6_ACTSU|nr:hypothetical protein [Actinobacillus suis]AFU20049.1 lipoprotein [Actinobacillus suis H91-0380]AIJ32188.1 lipoprotein [Actinobacillus suis ATCC 33415]MCO4167836.1 hypothetical protein [Actinobacillus suis]MCO4169726.1 hypothetical protein [Actinobacillus suis]MCQ9630787.1 hypothetical protein [Actinobacillus suis]